MLIINRPVRSADRLVSRPAGGTVELQTCKFLLPVAGRLLVVHAGRNGRPSRRSNSRASSSLLVVVTIVTFIP